MNYIFKGNTSGAITTDRIVNESLVTYIIVTNTSGAPITMNLKIKGDANVNICPKDLQLGVDESYVEDAIITLVSREQLELSVAGGSVDYYISISTDGNNS